MSFFPPTPSPSFESPSRRSSPSKLYAVPFPATKPKMNDQPTAGPTFRLPLTDRELPPTPPVNERWSLSDSNLDGPPLPSTLSFTEPWVPQRPRRGRRPASVYPFDDPTYQPHRNYTGPTAQRHMVNDDTGDPQQLDVDLDAYSTTEFEGEDGVEDREPTLSFVTTSTVESSASTPSIDMSYGIRTETGDGKSPPEPRIRMRTTTGRTNAYSSAESSTVSGAFPYAYPENQMYHPHPPPLPILPNVYAAEHVGLGITGDDLVIPVRQHHSQIGSPNSNPPISPSTSFVHRPWRRDVVNRLRSDSASSSLTTTSVSTSDTIPSDSGASNSDCAAIYPQDAHHHADRLPWTQELSAEMRSEAVAMVDEGRGKMLDMEKLGEMGGIGALTEEVIGSLAGITHLLLPSCGSSLIPVLPSLLVVLAPSLVVLDISHNDLTYLPAGVQACVVLEELNVSGNPLRHVPPSIGGLVSLRMLVVDGCGLWSLSPEISQLTNLHTLCARRNQLVSLPSWLCLLDQLETLRVDDNPFAKEWLPIVAPILAVPPRGLNLSSFLPRSTSQRQFRTANGLRSAPSIASMTSSRTASSMQSQHPSSSSASITVDAPWMSPSSTTAHSVYHLSGLNPIAEDHPHMAQLNDLERSSSDHRVASAETVPLSDSPNYRMVRKMPSAGTLLDRIDAPTSMGTSNTRSIDIDSLTSVPSSVSRFATVGPSSSSRSASATGSYAGVDEVRSLQPSRLNALGMVPSSSNKSGKWGFLRKMSMNKLKSDKGSALAASATANLKLLPPPLNHSSSDPVPTLPPRPGMSSTRSVMTLPTKKTMVPDVTEFGEPFAKMAIFAATLPSNGLPSVSSMYGSGSAGGTRNTRGKRRSFLPIDEPPSINISIPSTSPFIPAAATFEFRDALPAVTSEETVEDLTMIASTSGTLVESPSSVTDPEIRYATGLESIKSYLRDLFDLSRPPIEPYGGFEVVGGVDYAPSPADLPGSPGSPTDTRGFLSGARRARHLDVPVSHTESSASMNGSSRSSVTESSETSASKRFKNDRSKRFKVILEIYEYVCLVASLTSLRTERTYVRGLGELVSIYVKPAAQPINPGKIQSETVVPAAERKVVFGGIESILTIHRNNLLPALERAMRPLLEGKDDDEGILSTQTAHTVGEVFRTYIAYMKQYSTYINNFDNALSRMKTWTATASSPATPTFPPKPGSPNSTGIASSAVSVGMGMAMVSPPNGESIPHAGSSNMTTGQRKRVKTFLKINLESYLLLPIQRVPRYKLLLEDLAMCTQSSGDRPHDTLDDALNEIAGLASQMNEEKRDADSRLRLFRWQQRITGRGPSPLVQPHRKLIMDGALNLIRLVKKASSFVETDAISVVDAEQTITPAKVVVPVEYIAPEPMDRPIMLILCTDLLVLAQQRGEGWDGQVDLFNVLRMATLREPASIVHGNVLRVVDNKSIYYFNGGSYSSSTQWCRAINSARRR